MPEIEKSAEFHTPKLCATRSGPPAGQPPLEGGGGSGGNWGVMGDMVGPSGPLSLWQIFGPNGGVGCDPFGFCGGANGLMSVGGVTEQNGHFDLSINVWDPFLRPRRQARNGSSMEKQQLLLSPVPTHSYWDYLGCVASEGILLGFGNSDRAYATVGLNVAALALSEVPFVNIAAAGIATVYDVKLEFEIRETCMEEVYGHP